MSPRALVCAVLLVAAPAKGAELRQLTSVSIAEPRSSRPAGFTAFGDAILFSADTAGEGRELWISGGSGGGPRLLLDLVPGRAGSFPGTPVVIGARAFFAARDAGDRARLWETDGTSGGTRASALFPADATFSDEWLGAWPGWLLAEDAGGMLWRTDGASAATPLVQVRCEYWCAVSRRLPVGGALYLEYWFKGGGGRIERLAPDGSVSRIVDRESGVTGGAVLLGALGETVLYAAWPRNAAPELWAQGGTGAPVRVAALPGLGRHVGSGGALGGAVLFFAAGPDGVGRWLWRSDGTEAGTGPVAPLVAGEYVNDARELVVAGPRAFFHVLGERHALWTSDGTAKGTGPVLEVADPSSGTPGTPVALGDRVVFAMVRHAEREPGALWVSDGSAAGTAPIAEFPAQAGALARVRHEIWFAGADGAGLEPWRTDGTPAGTRRALDVAPDRAGAEPGDLVALGDAVLLGANDPSLGRELWRADATGASLLADLLPGPESSRPHGLVRAGEGVFLFTEEPPTPSMYGDRPTVGVFFTDGGAGAPRRLATGIPLPTCNVAWGGCVRGPAAVGGRVHFVRSDPVALRDELWVATAGGARAVGGDLSGFSWPAVLGDALWFKSGIDVVEARADGLSVHRLTQPSLPVDLTAAGERLFMIGATEAGYTGQPALWAREPSGAIRRVRVFEGGPPVPGSVYPAGALAWVDGRLHLAASAPATGGEPWVSDGTEAGTVLLREHAPGPAGSDPEGWTALGERVLFWADDGVHGREPWITDGTAAGTRLVADVWPGPAGSAPRGTPFVPLGPGGPVAFAASDGLHGMELWVSDGSAQGTRRATDLAPGPRSASPVELTVAGENLFLAAHDGAPGGQLYAVAVGELVAGEGPPGEEPPPMTPGDPPPVIPGDPPGAGPSPAEPTPSTGAGSGAGAGSGGCSSGTAGGSALAGLLLALLHARRARSRRPHA